MNKIEHLRITVYDLNKHDEFAGIYYELYEDKYEAIVAMYKLTCCQMTITPDNFYKAWETLLEFYEGRCYKVDAMIDGKYKNIVSGSYADDDYELFIQNFIKRNEL